MPRLHAIATLTVLSLAGCEAEDPAGTWVGELTETRSLAIVEEQRADAARMRRLGGGRSADGVEATVRALGDDRYALELGGCALDLSSDDGEHLRVAGRPTCELTFDGWTGTFTVRGSGALEEGALHLQLMGSTSGPGASGGFSWTFVGHRAA